MSRACRMCLAPRGHWHRRWCPQNGSRNSVAQAVAIYVAALLAVLAFLSSASWLDRRDAELLARERAHHSTAQR